MDFSIRPSAPWEATILTLFPGIFPGPLAYSNVGRALDSRIWTLKTLDIRSFASDKHHSVDHTAFGGGPGMVLRSDVVDAALDSVERAPGRRIYLTPRGRRFDHTLAAELAAESGIVLVCGRYEGLDQRVIDSRDLEEISLGDFILSGGELAALTIIDSVVRLLPGVLGTESGLVEESFVDGLLEYPLYTQPREWDGQLVPDVLLSGHHANIQAWRRKKAEQITKARRPDLWVLYEKEKLKKNRG